MEWDSCLLCQESKNEELRGRSTESREKDGDSGNTYKKLSKTIQQLTELDSFSLEHFGCENNEASILAKLKAKRAVYHHNCVSNFNKKLKRALEKREKESSKQLEAIPIPNKRSRRSEEQPISLGVNKCLFCMKIDDLTNLCAGGTQHATADSVNEENNRSFSEKLWDRASKLEDTRILKFLSGGTAASRELNYHPACLAGFHNRYTSKVNQEVREKSLDPNQRIKSELHFRKIIVHVIDQRQRGASVFTVNPLEKMYAEFLRSDDIPYAPHVSRFAERLKYGLEPSFRNNTGIEIRTIDRSVKLCFSSDVDEIIDKETSPATFVQSLIGAIAPIRHAMSKVKNTFKNSFSPNCQESSVPIQLQILCSLLIDGCDPKLQGFSQCSKTVSQLVMYQYRKMTGHSTDVVSLRRHPKERETPVPVYVGLKLYAVVRCKTVIQRLHSLGISISYERCLIICNNISLNMLKRYERDGVFVSSNLTLGTFTVIAKDNIDLNARSTKVKHHFHGISMTAMQFPSKDRPGFEQQVLYDLSLKIDKNHKLDLPEDYAVIQELPRRKNTPLFMPVCTSNINYESFGEIVFNRAKLKEIAWLASYETENRPWTEHRSKDSESSTIEDHPGENSLMPLMNEKVNTLKAQYHTMSVIKKTTHFINRNQIPVDASDQPVYALSKEIQLRYPTTFGQDKYITLLGDLHMEHTILLMHGQLIKGSGLDSILLHSKLSTEGTSAIVDANDIKRSRYCLQVSIVVIFTLLKQAHANSGSNLPVFEWLDKISKTSQMCFYWEMILNFQIQVLMFVRAIREGNFELYLASLYRFLPFFFALDRYNYARWATIHWIDLVLLEQRCPNEYKEFVAGNFSFLKTNTEFSRMALDQLHEQNNKYIKSVSGATSLINRQDDSALVRWELCGPEICRMLQDFEDIGVVPNEENDQQKHHENNPTFKKDFYNDTTMLLNNFPKNPFMLNELTVINNTDIIFQDNIYHNLTQLEPIGTKQLLTFIEDRLIKAKVSISTKITLNHFMLPGYSKSTKSRQSVVDKRLNQTFLTKLRAAITYRRQHAKLLFSSEIYNYAQSLSNDGSDLYHGTKSSILQRFEKTSAPSPSSASAALVVELSPMFRSGNHSGTFEEFAQRLFNEIQRLSLGYSRVDIICDRYFTDSLKNLTRIGRGQGPNISFEDSTPLPGKFNETFLKNNNNKERLNLYLAGKFHSFHQDDKQLIITKGDSVLSNENRILTDQSLSNNAAEEADQKLVRHMIQCVQSGVQQCTVRTVDTDVIVSLIAYRRLAEHFDCKVLGCLTTSSATTYYDINKASIDLGEQKCHALPFFYALTGCDIVSSFFNQGKCKFWDRWFQSEEEEALTNVFIALSEKPESVEDEQVEIIERYVGFVYYGRTIDSIDSERIKDFEHSTHSNLKLIPPSRSGLKEHIKRAAYYSGWLNYQCVENVSLPPPSDWGWIMVNGLYHPVWDSSDNSMTADLLTSTCGCTTQKCLKCKCAMFSLSCLAFCKCERNCLYTPV